MSTAVMICNMGGPNNANAVRPYLENIFRDPDIISIPLRGKLRIKFASFLANKRAPKTIQILESMDGKSPLLDITRIQAEKLEKELNDKADEFRVFPSMRYWHPLISDVWQEVVAHRFDRIVVVSMFAYYSTATAGSIANVLNELMTNAPAGTDVLFIDRFGNHPGFINAMAGQIKSYVDDHLDEKPVHILFSAHGIPLSRVKKGDPYQDEIEDAVQQLRKNLPDHFHLHLSYQSKVGPVKWLGPNTPDKIAELAANGVEALWVYPLGFVADNAETIYEIGSLYKTHALSQGITEYYRIPALNEHAGFMHTLANIIQNSLSDH